MSDEREKEEQGKGFTVSDRRKRYTEEEGGEPTTAEKAPPPVEPPPEPAVKPPEPGAGAGLHEAGADLGAPGPADFLQLIGKIYQEGLAFMGFFDDPRSGQSMANLPIASWHIDILGVLEEKTRGNLTDEEAKLLKEAVANLKLSYVRASGSIKH